MKHWMVTVVVVGLTGCTFIDQKVQIAPQIATEQVNLGKGKQVALKVVDERESSQLGKRGTGLVQGAKITTQQDVDELFTGLIKQGLRQKGFEAIPFEEAQPTVMRVEIRSLEYDVSAGLWTAGNSAKASIKVIASNGGKTYEKVYRGQHEIRTAFVASQETNAKIINEAVNQTLSRMFADRELLEFLAR